MLSFNDLCAKVLEILPNASLGEDLEGQIVIYTNLRVAGDDERLVDIDEDEL